MLIKRASGIKSSEITDKQLYMNRRQFISAAAFAVTGLASSELLFQSDAQAGQKLPVAKRGDFSAMEEQTSFKDATHYNNFYEFSTEKENVAELSRNFRTRPWTISVEGHIKKPKKVYDIDEIIKLFALWRSVFTVSAVLRDGPWLSRG